MEIIWNLQHPVCLVCFVLVYWFYKLSILTFDPLSKRKRLTFLVIRIKYILCLDPKVDKFFSKNWNHVDVKERRSMNCQNIDGKRILVMSHSGFNNPILLEAPPAIFFIWVWGTLWLWLWNYFDHILMWNPKKQRF